MKVYFLIFRTKSLYGRLISFWTRTPYTHVSFSLTLKDHFSNDSGQWRLIAIPKDKEFEVWELETTPAAGNYMSTFYQNLVQKHPKYDWLGVFGFFFKWKKENPRKYFCSEAFGKLMRDLYMLTTYPAYKYTPALVRHTLEVLGATKIKGFDDEWKQLKN